MNSPNPTRREVLKYLGMAPLAGMMPMTAATPEPVLTMDMLMRAAWHFKRIEYGTMTVIEIRALERLPCLN